MTHTAKTTAEITRDELRALEEFRRGKEKVGVELSEEERAELERMRAGAASGGSGRGLSGNEIAFLKSKDIGISELMTSNEMLDYLKFQRTGYYALEVVLILVGLIIFCVGIYLSVNSAFGLLIVAQGILFIIGGKIIPKKAGIVIEKYISIMEKKQ